MIDFANTMAYVCEKMYETANRRKCLQGDLMATRLERCLTTFDLALMGIGHMVGTGIYVLTGTLAKLIVGPALFISYIISGVAALFSALCFAEFATQVPKTGSSYTYTYITIGEFWAFIVGWNMILEHIVGVACLSRSFSGTINVLTSGRMTAWMTEHVGTIHLGQSNVRPDFIAFALVIFAMIFIATGAKCSARLNNILALTSTCCILLVSFTGMGRGDYSNWKDVPGGFMPYGTQGILAGAATSFYSYVGFDGIATASEEATNPRRSVPLATCIAMATVIILYVFASSALTFLVPYYDIDVNAPFPSAFDYAGLMWAVYIISIGSFCGLSTSLITGMFTLPRAVYAMAEDGLLFRCLSSVHPYTQTPLVATVTFGLLAGVLALFTDIEILVGLSSIGTLFSYTVVAVAVLILRYEPLTINGVTHETPTELTDKNNGENLNLLTEVPKTCGQLRGCLLKYSWLVNTVPSHASSRLVIIHTLLIIILDIVIARLGGFIIEYVWWAILLLTLSGSAVLVCFVLLLLYEQNTKIQTFQVPLSPFFPSICIAINVLLMTQLDLFSWIRLVVWIFIGLLIYVFYGVKNSNENKPLA